MERLDTGESSAHYNAKTHKPIPGMNLRRIREIIFRTGTEPALSHLIKRHKNEMGSKTGDCDHGQQVALQVIGGIVSSKS